MCTSFAVLCEAIVQLNLNLPATLSICGLGFWMAVLDFAPAQLSNLVTRCPISYI